MSTRKADQPILDYDPPTDSEDSRSISPGPELTIKNVANIKSLLDQKLLRSEQITIELGDLHKVDTAGLQLLFAVSFTLAKTDQGVVWSGSDEVVAKAASVLGLGWPPQADIIESEAPVSDAMYGFF